eukprot:scaffold13971_cov69-Phaeocystis_antarctica.AAC.13
MTFGTAAAGSRPKPRSEMVAVGPCTSIAVTQRRVSIAVTHRRTSIELAFGANRARELTKRAQLLLRWRLVITAFLLSLPVLYQLPIGEVARRSENILLAS